MVTYSCALTKWLHYEERFYAKMKMWLIHNRKNNCSCGWQLYILVYESLHSELVLSYLQLSAPKNIAEFLKQVTSGKDQYYFG